LLIDSASVTYRLAYFTGTYEDGIARVLSQLTRPTDVCVDAGANIGWHTTLLAARSEGAVHAFEPAPKTFDRLLINLELNGWTNKVVANRVALSESNGTATVHLFPDLPEGHASLSNMGRSNFEAATTPQITLDSYLAERHLAQVDVIKIDVEGSELALLRG